MVSKEEKGKLVAEREKKTKAQQKADARKKAKEEKKKTPIAK
jgi:hypothetical protein|tara:strand:+ start:489 stop:614 length:126 start_codon:yes stop_codon:yes gene_type:complete